MVMLFQLIASLTLAIITGLTSLLIGRKEREALTLLFGLFGPAIIDILP